VAFKNGETKVRFLRVLRDKMATECIFTQEQTDKGWSISSLTQRGATTMAVTARYALGSGKRFCRGTTGPGDRQMGSAPSRGWCAAAPVWRQKELDLS
jgi:hypothetical protein